MNKKTRKTKKSGAAAMKTLPAKPIKGETARNVKGGIHITRKIDSSSPQLFKN